MDTEEFFNRLDEVFILRSLKGDAFHDEVNAFMGNHEVARETIDRLGMIGVIPAEDDEESAAEALIAYVRDEADLDAVYVMAILSVLASGPSLTSAAELVRALLSIGYFAATRDIRSGALEVSGDKAD